MRSMLIKIQRKNHSNNWCETCWINLANVKSVMRHEYYPGKFSSLQIVFVGGDNEIVILEKVDEELANLIINELKKLEINV